MIFSGKIWFLEPGPLLNVFDVLSVEARLSVRVEVA